VSSINCPGGVMSSQPAAGSHTEDFLLGFSFDAPAGTSIVGYKRHAEGFVQPGPGAPPVWWWEWGEYGTLVGAAEPVGISVGGSSGTRSWDNLAFGARLSRLFVALTCYSQTGPGPCEANGSHFLVRWVTVLLEDTKPPQVVSASGSLLATGAPQRGERRLTLALRDAGGGLRETRLEVDGQGFSEEPITDARGTCRTPFVAPVPCPLSATAELALDTTRLPDGHHEVVVRVFDATGANSTTSGPISIDVDNVPDAPGPERLACPPSPEGKMTRRVDSRLTRYGGAVSIRGRVTRTPVPSDAVVTLVEPSGLRATDSAARVRRDGRFRIRLRPGRSRTVRPILVEASGNPRLCGESIHVKVRAGVAFAAAPKRLRNSEVINLRGRLRGLPLPRTGKTITIEARARGSSRWTTVTALRTGSSGRFAYRYRFRRTFQRTTYEFRAVSPSQRGYPFARGWSSVSRAVVRP
jgi:hypothetical protein